MGNLVFGESETAYKTRTEDSVQPQPEVLRSQAHHARRQEHIDKRIDSAIPACRLVVR